MPNRKIARAAAIAALAFTWTPFQVHAQAAPDILKAKGCLNCHDVEKKKVGPALKDIAARRAGKADEMVAKLKDAKGHPKVNATEAEIKAAVDQVLSTK